MKDTGTAGKEIDALPDNIMPNLPLISGERPEDFEAFQEKCFNAVQPEDAIEEVWLNDFVHYTWEVHRLRRIKVGLIQSGRQDALNRVLNKTVRDDVLNWRERDKIAYDWARRDKDAIDTVKAIFAEQELHESVIESEAISRNLETIEKLDRLIETYDKRKDSVIRELEKRRDTLARRAREFEATISEAEYIEIDPK